MKPLVIILFSGILLSSCRLPPANNNPTPLAIQETPPHPWSITIEDHLKTIQSGTTEQLGYEIYDIAATWAAAGFIEQANQLLAIFWKYKTTDPNDFHNDNDGFRVLWALSGKQPDSIPFELREVNTIVQNNWDDLFYPNRWPPEYRSQFEQKTWLELDGPLLCAKAIQLSFDADSPSRRASLRNRTVAVMAFSRFLKTDTAGGYDLFHTTTCAAIVAASIGKDTETHTFIRRWGQGYLQYPQSYMLQKLMDDTSTARYLLSGVLAPVWGITTASCTADLHRVDSVLQRRIKEGPSLVYGNLSLKELLHRIADSSLYPPATRTQIHAADIRLGVQLPPDYISFLLLSNGRLAIGPTGVTLLPVEHIGWLRDMDPELVKIWGKPMDQKDSARAAGFQRSILIGGYNEEQQLLLVPPGDSDKDWQCWFFASWMPGIQPYPNLRFFFEYELQRKEDDPL